MIFTMGFDICTRCNYIATFQWLLVNKFIIDLLYLNADSKYDQLERSGGNFSSIIDNTLFNSGYVQNFGRTYAWVAILVVWYLISGVDDIMTIFMLWSRLTTHYDLFNSGILIGKAIRIFVSIYFNGFIFYQNYLNLMSDLLLMLKSQLN